MNTLQIRVHRRLRKFLLDMSIDRRIRHFRANSLDWFTQRTESRFFYTRELTVLNFSAGVQSSFLLWLLIRNEIERPPSLLVVYADPGMENSDSYKYCRMMQHLSLAKGIDFRIVRGPNLYQDLLAKQGTRIDNPPYYTLANDGHRGRLVQKCTKEYKIAPMDRVVREVMRERHVDLGHKVVEKWIGFSADEVDRFKDSDKSYTYFRYPLYEMGLSKADLLQAYRDRDLPIPPRSVCNACFANGLNTLRQMYLERPEDWKQAVAVDKAVRDMSQYRVRDQVFVSDTRVPLEELAKNGFRISGASEEDVEKFACDSGVCFT